MMILLGTPTSQGCMQKDKDVIQHMWKRTHKKLCKRLLLHLNSQALCKSLLLFKFNTLPTTTLYESGKYPWEGIINIGIFFSMTIRKTNSFLWITSSLKRPNIFFMRISIDTLYDPSSDWLTIKSLPCQDFFSMCTRRNMELKFVMNE